MAALYVRWVIPAERWLRSGRAPSDALDDSTARACGRALIAATLRALLAGWIVIGYTVREATERRRAAERVVASGLRWLQVLSR